MPLSLARADEPTPKPVTPPAPKAEIPRADAPKPERPAPVAPGAAVTMLKTEAETLKPLMKSTLAKKFLDATELLPTIAPRTLYRVKGKPGEVLTEHDVKGRDRMDLPPIDPGTLVEQRVDERLYYYTGFGSPLVYARLIDILAANGVDSLVNKKVLDYGYGSIGQIRLMASLGANANGAEVSPLLNALYSEPGDQGKALGVGDITGGTVSLYHGQWPGNTGDKVGKDFDIITSKNTLKRGYLHPERETNKAWLVDLGVSDEAFLAAVNAALRPGGLFLIYNISPAQNPPDKPFLPHADGRCGFTKEQLEAAGFTVLNYDTNDIDTLYPIFAALGYTENKPKEEAVKNLFAHYTLCRKPETKK
jgi:hypothetical protein